MARRWRRLLGLVAATSFGLALAAGEPVAATAAASGTLFAITRGQMLVKVDPAAGAITTVADLNGPDSPWTVSLASDPIARRLYAQRRTFTYDPSRGFVFTYNVLTIDSATGAILASPQISDVGLAIWGAGLAVDWSSGKLYGFDGRAVVSVDPSTGASTVVATVIDTPPPEAVVFSVALDSHSHTVYLSREDFTVRFRPQTTIFSVDVTNGAVRGSPVLDRPVREILLDSASLFGITDGFTNDLVAINNIAGTTTVIGSVPGPEGLAQFVSAADSATHTIFAEISVLDPVTFTSTYKLVSMNDVTGARIVVGIPADSYLEPGMAFEPASPVTPDSIKADVGAARASGAIDNSGIANSFLAKLDAAADARTGGDCATSANIYEAFVNELDAQSGKHVAADTATQLIREAEFLTRSCP